MKVQGMNRLAFSPCVAGCGRPAMPLSIAHPYSFLRDSVDSLEMNRTAAPPSSEVTVASLSEDRSETAQWRPTREHVVVCVDDEVMVLNSLRRLLRGEPYTFRATADPREALGWVGAERVSVFVADQRMPEMSGTELVEAVKGRSPETLRVILTGYPDLETIRQRDGHVIRRLITKPWSDADLKRTLRLLLRECERRETAPGGVAGGPPCPEREPGGDRILVRIECRGRSVNEALDPLVAAFQHAEAAVDGVLVEIHDLAELREPFSSILTALSAQVLSTGIRTSIRDRSGIARVFYRQFFGSSAPVDVEPVAGVEEPSPP